MMIVVSKQFPGGDRESQKSEIFVVLLGISYQIQKFLQQIL
jgi:hypothetical protein